MRRWLLGCAAGAVGCSLLVDTGGLAGGPGASDGGADPIDSGAVADEAGVPDAADDAGSPFDFVDLFDRPDGVVGNGWIESLPDVFSLLEGRVVAKSGVWTERFLYRPENEDLLDAEASVEIRWKTTPTRDCDASLWLRTRRSGKSVSSYAAFIDDRESLSISRVIAGDEDVIDNERLPEPINTTDVYRMRFRVEGTSPVHLVATFERSTPSGWSTLSTLDIQDRSNDKIVGPGGAAISSDINATFSYDVFTRTKL